MIKAGEIYYSVLHSIPYPCQVLTTPKNINDLVLFTIGGHCEDTEVASASDLEKIIHGRGCRKAWTKRGSLGENELANLQQAVLDCDMAKFKKNLLRRHLGLAEG